MHKVYSVARSLTVVELKRVGAQLTGTIAEIPAGVVVQLCGNSDFVGMVDVEWNGRQYALFLEDLEARGEIQGKEPTTAQAT